MTDEVATGAALATLRRNAQDDLLVPGGDGRRFRSLFDEVADRVHQEAGIAVLTHPTT